MEREELEGEGMATAGIDWRIYLYKKQVHSLTCRIHHQDHNALVPWVHLKKTCKIFQASQRALSTTIQSKVGIQVHNNKKNQQQCKTVTDDIHNKHNASTLALHLYRTFLNIVWRIVLLTFTQYLVTIHLHHWGVECDIGVYSFCLQLLIYTSCTSSKVRFHSPRSQDGIFPQDFTISPRKLQA